MFRHILRRLLWIGLALVPALALAPVARAVPVTYDFTLTAAHLGSSFGGISALPAGPFTGSFTLEGEFGPAFPLQELELTAFSATVGTQSWDLDDVVLADFFTDELGELGFIDLAAVTADNVELHLNYFPYFAFAMWFAREDNCTFGPLPDGFLTGNCISGDPNEISLTLTQVPEPATLGVLVTGLVGLAWAAHRRRFLSASAGS
jgi:hypothetical protein